jgi:glycosyltransferase involved in cell wall biosynthesis
VKIGVEMRLITPGPSGGISTLLRGVLTSAFHRYQQHQFFCFTTIFNRGLLGQVPHNVQVNTFPLFSYFDDVDRQCRQEKIDVLFRSYPLEQKVEFPLHRQIVLIPDIQHEYFPDFFEPESLRSRRTAFAQVLGGAGAIGTISEFARQSLLKQPSTKCRDIFLMSPALQVEHQQVEELTNAEKRLIPRGNFFLFPANLWKHKNHERILQAFERSLAASKRSIQFVFTGHHKGWEVYRKRYGHLPIRHLGFVRPALIRKLLEKAQALVFFSLFEGFGIPLLEAFAAGTPVVCSNTTSLPEVGGDAVLTCDPTDVEAMSKLMVRIINEPNLRHELVRGGKQRLKAYSWDESADNLAAACERVRRQSGSASSPEPVAGTDLAFETKQNVLPDESRPTNRNCENKRNLFSKVSDYLERRETLSRAKRLLKSLDLKQFDGIWSDNWVGPLCRVTLEDVPFAEQIQLSGTPTTDMELMVAVNNRPIGVFPLREEHVEEILFQVKPCRQLHLLLYFSGHKVDTVGRKLSFRLLGSNLFTEKDLRDLVV